MACYLCGSNDKTVVSKGTRDKKDVNVLRCNNCSLIYLSNFNHVDIKLYENDGQAASINQSDVQVPLNYNDFDTQKRYSLYNELLWNKTILDFGCGKGNFIKKIKDNNISSDIYALEPNELYQKFLSQHFKYVKTIDEIPNETIDIITLFHVMEHLKDPIFVLNSFYDKLKVKGKIIIEVPHAEDVLVDLYENESFKKFTYWSLHLFLFNRETLKKLASKTPFKISYIKYYQRYPLSNTLYWLAKGKPQGQDKWFFLNDKDLNKNYEKKLIELGKTDTILMCLEKD